VNSGRPPGRPPGRRRGRWLSVRRWPAVAAAAALALALALLAAACSGSGSTATSGPATTAPVTPAPTGPAPTGPAPAGPAPATLAQYYAQHLSWQSCDNGFQCARLLVPFDYAHPAGKRFSLPVVKLAASDPGRRVGALVINPGGPGGSGVSYALGARGEFPAALRARFDIVGFDPRGVAGSQPALACMTGPQLDAFLATDDMPSGAAQLAQIVTVSRQYAARCEQNSGALLPYVGTENAARDMDVLRAALGQAKLTYLGKSYGTYLGAWYAQLFPHRVRALVLDGAFDPDTPALQDDMIQAQGFQVALQAFTTSCLAAAGCPLGAQGSSVEAAEGKLQALIVRANSHPLTSHLGNRQVADGAMLLNGVASALYSRAFWPDLKTGLAGAVQGDGSVLLQLADLLLERNPNGTYANLADADTAISCLDRPVPRSLAPWQAAARQAAQAAPLFGAPIVWGSLTCAYWPVKSYPLPVIRATGAPPILVVGTLRDPATPYRWAQALSSDLSSGVLLGWNGDGHTAYGEGSSCVDTIVNDYFVSLKVPRSAMVCG
jgi:pimeloyl-ACP methyl ester carboxylesterase